MNENLKRLLTFLVAASMVFSMLPMTAWADSSETLQPEEGIGPRDPAISGGTTQPTEPEPTEPESTEPVLFQAASFEVYPLSLVEGTCGCQMEDADGQGWYYYAWGGEVPFRVTMTDGTVYETTGGFEHNGQYYYISYSNSQFENHWLPGNTYTDRVWLSMDGYGQMLEAEASITITPSPVDRIEFRNKVVLAKNTFGNYQTDENGNSYYHYYWQPYLEWTVYYKDGSSNTSRGCYVEYNGEEYYIDHIDPQSVENPWGVDTYEVEMSFMGKTAVATIQIVETLVQDVQVSLAEFLPHTNGGISTDEDGNAYFEYYWGQALKYTVTMIDGTVAQSYGDYFWYNGTQYWIDTSDDQSYTNQWTADNTYMGKISVLGYTKEIPIRILPSPVIQANAQPVTICEGSYGSIRDEYPDDDGPVQSYFYYDWIQNAHFVIALADGSTISGYGNGFYYQNQWCYVSVIDGQSAATPWTAGNTYYVTAYILGAEFTVPVTITEDPVQDVVFEAVSVKEYTGGYWTTDHMGREYYYYHVPGNLRYTIYFTDGTTQTGSGMSFYYQGQYHYFGTWAYQDYENQWLAGNTYQGNVEVMGKYYAVPINIYREVNSSGYTYMLQNEKAIITDCRLEDEVLQIPDTLDGYPVAGILSLGCAIDYATTLRIPDSVTMLSEKVFKPYSYWRLALKELVLGAGVTQIDLDMLRDAEALRSIVVSENNPVYSSCDGVLYTKDLTEMVVYPFAKTETHIIPDSVINIDVIFNNPDLYQDINFLMGAGVQGYVVENGVIYNQEKTRIIMTTAELSGDYVMPETVTSVSPMAFAGSGITSATVSKNVTTITYGMFMGCKALENVTLPEGVKWIGPCAFERCSSLEQIHLPSTVKAIYFQAFSGCYTLDAVSTPSLEAWCSIVFEQSSSNPLSYGENLYADGELVRELKIPSTIQWVYDYAFVNSSIVGVSVPSNVYGIGEYAFSNSQVTSLELSEGLLGIDRYAFYSTPLKKVTLPDSMHYLGACAFHWCEDLTQVTLGSGIRVIESFTFCWTGLESVTIPEQVEYIGYCAFASSKLKALDLQCTSVQIGESAFSSCPLQGTLEFGDNVTLMDWNAFEDTDVTQVKLPTSVTELTYRVFGNCENLVSITIPDNITEIWDNAFEGSYNLSHVLYTGTEAQWNEIYCGSDEVNNAVIHFEATGNEVTTEMTCGKILYTCSICNKTMAAPRKQTEHDYVDGVCTICGHDSYWEYSVDEQTGTVTILGYNLSDNNLVIPSEMDGMPVTAIAPYAFADRTFRSVEIPDSVTTLGAGAFQYCWNLSSVTLSKNITEIADKAFYRCTNLCNVELHEGITEIGEQAFSRTNISSVKLPSTVSVVRESAFECCWNLSEVELNNGLAIIENYAFFDCYEITELQLPATVSMIGYYAFENLGISELTIPASVKDLCMGAFSWCYSLEKIYFLGDAVSMYDVFCEVSATAYYPATNSTWDNANLDMAGNYIKWVGLKPVFTQQPQGVSISQAGIVSVTAQADGEELTYRWYSAAPGSDNFQKTQQTGQTFAVDVTESNSGTRVYCEATDVLGQTVRSDIATLQIGTDTILGDLDGNGSVNVDDVFQLLLFVSMPDVFPVQGHADFDGSGFVDVDDVFQLLLHVSMPDVFPLQ